MEIDFYEEFPTEENLEKLKLIRFPIRLFVAAKSIGEFKEIESKIKKIKANVEIAYWPVIQNSYWISPFSNTKDLRDLFRNLDKIENPLLIDLELPKDRKIIRKNLLNYFKNKGLIKKFLEKNKDRIATAEFPVSTYSLLMKILGLDYNIKTEKSLMWYSSMNSTPLNKDIRNNLPKIKNKRGYSISLGTIAVGVLGNEPILPSENLEKDLNFVKNAGFEKVVIFRLGGLNKDYIKVLEKFTK